MSVICRKTGRTHIPTLHTETMKNVDWKHSACLNSLILYFAEIVLYYEQLADTFIQSDLHRLTASSSGAVSVKCLPQTEINTHLGGAGD